MGTPQDNGIPDHNRLADMGQPRVDENHSDLPIPQVQHSQGGTPPPRLTALDTPDGPSHPRTVLIVDDSPTIRKIVRITLERELFKVIAAEDGLSALTTVADAPPSLILLDADLPRMDGYHICQIIRKNLQFRQLPIILLSGRDGLFDKLRARLAGSTDFLDKPFDSHKLTAMVKQYIA